MLLLKFHDPWAVSQTLSCWITKPEIFNIVTNITYPILFLKCQNLITTFFWECYNLICKLQCNIPTISAQQCIFQSKFFFFIENIFSNWSFLLLFKSIQFLHIIYKVPKTNQFPTLKISITFTYVKQPNRHASTFMSTTQRNKLRQYLNETRSLFAEATFFEMLWSPFAWHKLIV